MPYVAYAVGAGCFQTRALLAILALAGVLAFWYVAAPRHAACDAGFLVLVAGVTLVRAWTWLYPSPAPRLPMSTLGQLMWIRVGILSALVLRRPEGIGFGWWPRRTEWWIGLRYFLVFLPTGLALAWVTGFWRGTGKPLSWPETALEAGLTFLGMLWVVALSEEFFFRGLMQAWLQQWLGSARLGLATASVVFGLAHLPFRGFPNWRFALLAAVAGCFYGRAFQVGGGIRAAMVAHALTNTVWRVLLG